MVYLQAITGGKYVMQCINFTDEKHYHERAKPCTFETMKQAFGVIYNLSKYLCLTMD